MTYKHQLLKEGYVVLKDALPFEQIDKTCALIQSYLEESFSIKHKIHSPEFSLLLKNNPGLCTCIYDSLQQSKFHFDCYRYSKILTTVLFDIFNSPIVYAKAPLRVDVPYESKEMTSWHQDFFHCQGSVDFISAYIPFSDLSYIDGALSIIPNSHINGPLDHISWGDTSGQYNWTGGNKRRFCPTALNYSSFVQELSRGDILLFSGLLLHQTNINLGSKVNFNINYRFSDMSHSHNPNMLEPIQIRQ